MVLFPPDVLTIILAFNDYSQWRSAARIIQRVWRGKEYRRLGWAKRHSLYLDRDYFIHVKLGLSQWSLPSFTAPFSSDHIGELNFASPYAPTAKRMREEYLGRWFSERRKRVRA